MFNAATKNLSLDLAGFTIHLYSINFLLCFSMNSILKVVRNGKADNFIYGLCVSQFGGNCGFHLNRIHIDEIT